jgi:hypothetical protein
MRKHYVYESPFTMKDKNNDVCTLRIIQDEVTEDPRAVADNICTMICWHRDYDLGDNHNFDNPDEFMQNLYLDVTSKHWIDDHDSDDWQDVYKELKETNLVLIKPINLYDHSGITVSTSNSYPYNDRWDAGCVGFIYVTKKTILDSYEHVTEENWKEYADQCIESEMTVYDNYVRGNTYGYVITKKILHQDKCPHCGEIIKEYTLDDEIDSCWGFYGVCLEENGILDELHGYTFIED